MLTLSTWFIFSALLILICNMTEGGSMHGGLINTPLDVIKRQADTDEEEDEESKCRFPPPVRGYWIRSHDNAIISIYSDLIVGTTVNVSEVELSDFRCFEVVGNLLVMRNIFEDEKRNYRSYYQCWQVNSVTDSVLIVYDLSETLHHGPGWSEARRYSYAIESFPGVNKVCPRFDSKELYSIFIKNETNTQTLKAECPPTLLGVFKYSQTCKQSSLDFCSVRFRGVLNFSLCKEPIVDSSDGVLTCLGFRDKDAVIYASFLIDKKVICFVFPRIFRWTFTGMFYPGDCTTAKDKPVRSIIFVLVNDCDNNFSNLSAVFSDAISWRRASDWSVSIEAVLALFIVVTWEHAMAAGFLWHEIHA